jgi:hypothetical protein
LIGRHECVTSHQASLESASDSLIAKGWKLIVLICQLKGLGSCAVSYREVIYKKSRIMRELARISSKAVATDPVSVHLRQHLKTASGENGGLTCKDNR